SPTRRTGTSSAKSMPRWASNTRASDLTGGQRSMLQIEQLTKRYRTGDAALGGVDLTVGGGEVIGLIGPSGAGKSTLIRCVNRLVEPTSGRILLNGTDLVRLSRGELRKARRR